MAETMWHTVLQSQIIHPDWSAQEHMDYLEEEGFDTSTIDYPRVVDCSSPLEVVEHWLDVNPTLPMFQRLVEQTGHFMSVDLETLVEGDKVYNPGNASTHKVESVRISGRSVYVRATAWDREGVVGFHPKILREARPSDIHSGLYKLPVGTTVKVEPTDGHCPYLAVVMGSIMNGPAGSLVNEYLVMPDGAKVVEIAQPHWLSIRKAP